MERIIITLPKNEKIKQLIVSFLQELKVNFELSSKKSKETDELDELIKKGNEEYEKGLTTKISMEELKDYLNL